jgi:DNA-binding LytR/AlgR family response regulator
MNILIANTDKQQINRLTDFINQYDKTINILGLTSSADETRKFLNQKGVDADLIFLGMQAWRDASIEPIGHNSLLSQIVLTSTAKQDAYEAIKAKALDFLLEPFEPEDVAASIDRARLQVRTAIQDGKGFKKRFMIKVGERIIFKNTDDISHIFADGKMIYLVTRDTNRRYIIENTLDELEKKYLDPAIFYRINRKFIVHVDSIEEARYYVNSRLKLILNPPVQYDMIVSREKVSDFKKWLNL